LPIESCLSHVCFSTKNLKSTFQFYNGILGYELIHEFVNEHKVVYGMIFSVGHGTFIEFFTNDEHSSLGEVFRHFCISVTDINELSKIFSFHSIPFSINRGRTDNTLQGWVTDPNGIRLEFHEYDAKSLLNKYVKL
jgi:catechol 2,3-dioxygenase-like lactoylglutathione lyase family enzyme